MDSNDGNNAKKIIAAFVVILAVVLVTVGVNAFNKKQKTADDTATNSQTSTNTATAPENNTTTPTTDTSTTDSTSTNLKDGTYTAKSEYYVPPGYEDISVTLTIKDGVVTDSQVAHSEHDRESARYQERFSAGYKSYVVGKKVSGLKVPYIAGASDTADGFNDALQKILTQAQV